MIGTDAGQQAKQITGDGTVPLTRLQVTECFRMVMDLLKAQQLASLSLRDLAESLPPNLLPEHQCTVAFLASAIDKVDDVLAGVVGELEVLRATVGGTASANASSPATSNNE